jgi:glutaminyl-tRNA synthetase
VELEAEVDMDHHKSGKKPPKGVLNWVAAPGPGLLPEKAEVRVIWGGDLRFRV